MGRQPGLAYDWHDDRPPSVGRYAAGLVWLGFILGPIVDALGSTGQPALHYWLVVGGAVAFAAVYIAMVLNWADEDRPLRSHTLGALQLALAVALTIGDKPSWGYLFCYCAACAPMVAPQKIGFLVVLALTGIQIAATKIAGAGIGTSLGFAASVVGVGLLMTLMRDLRVRNRELADARAELAQTAVAAERERFARDLHDLLGHSLSVIAIKAELAGRLLPGSPERAASEVADLESVARQALSEVRQAVSGYRQPTLSDELEGARVALSAAGIDASIDGASVSLDPEVDAVLAWTVREGATNVIRHSGARHCSVRVRASSGDAGVEVLDDGSGIDAGGAGDREGAVNRDVVATGAHGNGLAGLRERAMILRGRIEAGAVPDGGFRLAVSVPVSSGAPSGDP
jgi:two-component system, NarL family, sensor histidine kinase DesK